MLSGGAAALAGCGPSRAKGFRGYCLVANRSGRNIGVIDLFRFRLRKEIGLDGAPEQMACHPTAPRAYASLPEAGSIVEIDGEKLTTARRVRIGNRLAGISMARGKAVLWALSREPAELVEIPLDSFAPRRRIRLPWPPDSFTLSETMAAVASRERGAIALAPLQTAAIARIVETRDEPSILHFRLDGAQLIVGSHGGRVLTVYDAAGGRTLVRLPVGLAPRNFCPDNSGGQLYVTGDGMDAVVVVYPYETEIGQTILAGRAPGAMAVTLGDSPLLLVANPESDCVTALDANNTGKSFVTTVAVGQEPGRIAITPDNQFALVLNRRSGDVSVIRRVSIGNGRPFRRPTPMFTMIASGEEPVDAAIVPWPAA